MGFFSAYVYKNKKGDKYWLHSKDSKKIKLYYFSKDSAGALPGIPKGFEVVESERTSLPLLKKKEEKKK